MSQLTKSLEKRIQELTASIDSQKTELAAYERVLHMELSKENAPAEATSVVEEAPDGVSEDLPTAPPPPAAKKATPSISEMPAKANKTTMVAEVVKSHGSEGATPKDIDAFFTENKIERSKNLIYNTLSYLVAHKKLTRRDGRYFALGTTAAVAKKTSAASTSAAPTKRRLSPEGLQRIKDALKKRWAAKRAAEQGGAKPAPFKRATKKK